LKSMGDNNHIDLRSRAHAEMVEAGFAPDFEPSVMSQAQSLNQKQAVPNDSSIKDLRSLLWSSIDNPDSRDLDQLEYVERLADGTARVMVAIADVDALVSKGSAIDRHAATNTTSIYTGIVTYPMLPDVLSFDLTSLIQDADRRAIVIDLIVDQTGAMIKNSVYLGLVRNQAKLDYPTIGTWLESGGAPPDKVANVPGLSDQLLLQNQIQKQIHALRQEQGSLQLHTPEATTIAVNGVVLDLELVEENPARELIENFMISGNIAVSHFLADKKLPSIRRIVKTPEKWQRIVEVAASYGEALPPEPDARALAKFLIDRKKADPLRFPDLSLTIVKLLGRGEYVVEVPGQVDQGHFALAVHDYTHATAPNRRYPDLATQRLVKAAIASQPAPYTLEELDELALHCTEREEAAKKVERTMRKVAAAVLLSKHIGELYDGIVTGVQSGATYARLFKPPAEGRIIKGENGLKIGDKVKLKLVSTDPERAYIDFAKV
jgi:VacB/RNase II family 3'-5' exoribonuclease